MGNIQKYAHPGPNIKKTLEEYGLLFVAFKSDLSLPHRNVYP